MILIFLFVCVAFQFDIKKVPKSFLEPEDDGDTWVILVAGAKGWSNYWSQAQVYAAYQQLHQAGIPDDRMIVWHTDDIANNRENPTKGKVYLYDGGPEVYHDVPKDLTGIHVDHWNFEKLLKGEKISEGSGKYLQSTSNDRIFLYFSDHGGAGVICFPGMRTFHVKEFTSLLEGMHQNNMYQEMVIYLDTCESGSMFNGHLPDNWNIYAVTSSDPEHVAWLCDCRWLGTEENDFPCTSNCWGKYWIEDALWSMGNGTFAKRTFEEQYITCRNHTYHDECYYWPNCTQQSCRYGDLSIASDNALCMFEGPGHATKTELKKPTLVPFTPWDGDPLKVDRVSVHLSKWLSLKKKATISNSLQTKNELSDYEEYLRKVDSKWFTFADYAGIDLGQSNEDVYDCYPKQIADPDCLKRNYEIAEKYCGRFDSYSIKYGKMLSMACQQNVELEKVEESLKTICLL